MCQLLGLHRVPNAPSPVADFDEFALRGGLTDAHADGWGLARCAQGSLRWSLAHGVEPGCDGPLAALLREALRAGDSTLVAHLRRATIGEPQLLNQHPFSQRAAGRSWAFAHNGHLRGLEARLPAFCAQNLPQGSTDSEAAFCWLLTSLRSRFGSQAPSGEALFEAVAEWHEDAETLGPLNSLLGDGQRLFAHCSTRLCVAEMPGAVLFATQPVGDAPWVALSPGQTAWAENGRLVCVRDRAAGAPPTFEAPESIGAASLAADRVLARAAGAPLYAQAA